MEPTTRKRATGIAIRIGSFLGSLTASASQRGREYSTMAWARIAASTSAGLALRGQRVEQSPQLWHSHGSALLTTLSFRPQDDAIISLRGKGLLSGEIGQATEQVAHW